MKECEKVEEHFNKIAPFYDKFKRRNWYYYNNIKAYVQRNIRPESRVLEIGCGTGEIISAIDASYAVGVDCSEEMIKIAKKKYANIHFIHSSIEELELEETFDFIIMTDLIHHVYDVMKVS